LTSRSKSVRDNAGLREGRVVTRLVTTPDPGYRLQARSGPKAILEDENQVPGLLPGVSIFSRGIAPRKPAGYSISFLTVCVEMHLLLVSLNKQDDDNTAPHQ